MRVQDAKQRKDRLAVALIAVVNLAILMVAAAPAALP